MADAHARDYHRVDTKDAIAEAIGDRFAELVATLEDVGFRGSAILSGLVLRPAGCASGSSRIKTQERVIRQARRRTVPACRDRGLARASDTNRAEAAIAGCQPV